jgi:hypothetical protein
MENTHAPITMFEKAVKSQFKMLVTTHGAEGDICIWGPNEKTGKLRKKYRRALANARYLYDIIKARENARQESCDHDWEYEHSRDERTRYTCKNCGLFR